MVDDRMTALMTSLYPCLLCWLLVDNTTRRHMNIKRQPNWDSTLATTLSFVDTGSGRYIFNLCLSVASSPATLQSPRCRQHPMQPDSNIAALMANLVAP